MSILDAARELIQSISHPGENKPRPRELFEDVEIDFWGGSTLTPGAYASHPGTQHEIQQLFHGLGIERPQVSKDPQQVESQPWKVADVESEGSNG